MSKSWTEVTDIDLVRDRAERLLAQHALRAADALQLGACLGVDQGAPRGREFISADGELATAALEQGFDVRIPRES